MKHSKTSKVLAVILCMMMLLSALPISAFAAVDYTHDSATTSDNYYNVVSKKDWDIAPGISEAEIQLKSKDGTRNQRAHVMVADMNNEYTKVTTCYTNMDTSVYRTSTIPDMAQDAIDLGWNVVGAMNTCLSWYTNYPAEHVNEPLGFMMIDGETMWDLTKQYGGIGFPECLIINKVDSERPRVEIRAIRSTADLTGDEEQVIPCSSGYIVKEGKNVAGAANHKTDSNNSAPRSVVGITADGKVIAMMVDGRASFSDGFTQYESAELMLDLGCVYAVNCDGGGSSTFMSKRAGEDLDVHCRPSDGSLRTNTSGILFISTAPSDGQFALAHISTEIDNKYYAPNSTVQFNALGTDLVGTATEIPAEAVWTIKEEGMGTISDTGLFTSNGTPGTVTAQIKYEDKVVGSCEIEIVVPTAFAFTTKNFAVKFGTSYELTTVATVNNGVNEVVLPEGVVSIVCDNADIGAITGTMFTAVAEANAPDNKAGTITASLAGTSLTATATLRICREITEIVEDFEDGVADWHIWDVWGDKYVLPDSYSISAATAANGQVHDGNGSMRVQIDQIRNGIPLNGGSQDYAQLIMYPDKSIILENVESYGWWIYIPFDFYTMHLCCRYYTDENNDGVYEQLNKYTDELTGAKMYENWNESGWYYISVPVGGKNIAILGKDSKSYTNNAVSYDTLALVSRPLEIQLQPAHEDQKFYDYKGTVNGKYTLYVDSLTVDYAKDVADRVAPEFGTVTLLSEFGDNDKAMENHAVVTTNSNILSVAANVSDAGDGLNGASAKAFVDGVEVSCEYSDGRISISNIAVANGTHRVKFEIADRAGNKNVVVRLVKVASAVDASTIVVEPKDPTLDRILYGSVYWMNLKATDIETIDAVTTVIDLNSVNHWELDHMELAAGFTATYAVDEETNTATITITRTGKNTQTGEAVLASLPIRIVDLEHDIIFRGFTAEEFWATHNKANSVKGCEFWAQDLKVDVLSGVITFVDGCASDVMNTFSNENFSVDTETFVQWKTMSSDYTAYYNEHKAVHTHTAEPMEDKDATEYEDGYTGRTFCAVCNSVVDWGDTIPALGHQHTYELVNGKFVCSDPDCGEVYDAGTGLFEMNGKYYYALLGELMTGWQPIDADMYYFDKDNYAAASGEQIVNGHNYLFDVTGKIIRGSLEKIGTNIVYYWADGLTTNGWTEINGNTYFFDGAGHAFTGVRMVTGWGVTPTSYLFSEDGILSRESGLYFATNGDIYYLDSGKLIAKGLVKDANGDYYYIAGDCKALKDCSYGIGENKANGLVPEGIYSFGPDGKMIVEKPEPEKQGLVIEENGDVVYYEDGIAQYAGLVKDDEGNFYYINSSKKAIKNCKYGVSKTNGLLPEGLYEFGPDGKMIVEKPEPEKQGLVIEENGDVMYYIDGIAQYAGLVKDDEGNYYYINSSKKAVKDCKYGVTKTNDLLPSAIYEFGSDGKMIVEKPEPEKQGLVIEENGDVMYYIDGIAQYAGLVKDDEGNYYYINSSKKAVKDCKYGVTKTNDLLPSAIYEFGPDGKIILAK